MKLQGKVALVTGAGRGIGKAIALAFAREGAAVVVNDVALRSAEQTCDELKESGCRVLAIEADVGNARQVNKMFQVVSDSFNRIDILVNNAGVQTVTPFLEIEEKTWDWVINTNLKGTFLCSQAAAQMMMRNGGGSIVNITSVHQELPRLGIAHYAASKGGILMLTRVMALELAQYRIRVNCVAPGAIATPMNQDVLDSPAEMARLLDKIPWGRIGQPKDIAAAVLYLVSDEAEYVTGSTLYIDGGIRLSRIDTMSDIK